MHILKQLVEPQDNEWQALWNFALECYRPRIQQYINELHPLFGHFWGHLQDQITHNFVFLPDDAQPKKLIDSEVNNRLLELRRYICTGSVEQMKKKTTIAS